MSNMDFMSSFVLLTNAALRNDDDAMFSTFSNMIAGTQPVLDNAAKKINIAVEQIEEQVSLIRSMFEVREEEAELKSLMSQTTLGISFTNLVQKYDAEKFADLIIDGQKLSERLPEQRWTELLTLFNKRVNRNRAAYQAAPELRESFKDYHTSKADSQFLDLDSLKQQILMMRDTFNLDQTEVRAQQAEAERGIMQIKTELEERISTYPDPTMAATIKAGIMTQLNSLIEQLNKEIRKIDAQEEKNRPLTEFVTTVEEFISLLEKVDRLNISEILGQFDPEIEAEVNGNLLV